MWGQQDAYWIAWYLFPHKHLRAMHSESDTELLMQWAKLAQASGWVYPFKGVCFVCDRPSEIHRDEQGLLHNEKGPSVSFVDTWSLYHWHGVEIPGEWIKTPPTAQEAISWENVEQRRAACELVGWHNVLDQLDAKTIDKDANPQIGTLLEVDLPDSGRERFLQVRCGTGRDFALPVPPDVNTALEANAWTYDVPTQVIQAIEVRT